MELTKEEIQAAAASIETRDYQNNIDRLFAQITHYRSSCFFKNMLAFVTQFKDLAPYNAMLVRIQKRGARYVLSAAEWKRKYHRLLSPTAQPLVTLYKFGPIMFVFDISDTIPTRSSDPGTEEILAHLEQPFKTDEEPNYREYDNLMNNLKLLGISVNSANAGSGWGASICRYDDRTVMKIGEHTFWNKSYYLIKVNDKASKGETFASVCHELGHLLCRHLPSPINKNGDPWWKWRNLDLNQKEFEAEIVSYIVCQRHGINNRSWEYLSCYLDQHDEIPEISVERVFKAANKVEDLINGNFSPKNSFLFNKDDNYTQKVKLYWRDDEDRQQEGKKSMISI